jgi:hypothetical protein
VSLAYRMQDHTREEMAAEDPYEGRGTFLPAPGATGAEMLARLREVTGEILPALAWEGIGVWADLGSSRSGADLCASWQEAEQHDP